MEQVQHDHTQLALPFCFVTSYVPFTPGLHRFVP